MKLLFLTRSPVDETPYAEIALPALADDGWEIEIIAPNAGNSILSKVRPFRSKRIDLASGKFAQEFTLARALLSVRFRNFDVVYINSQTLAPRAAIYLTGPNFGKRLVYHNPDFFDPQDHPIYCRLERRLCRKIDLYLNNEFHRAYINWTYYGMRTPTLTVPPNLPAIWPIHELSDEKRAALTKGHPGDAFVVMLHGGFSRLRMVPQLFKALSLLPSRFRLVMTSGKAGNDEAENLARTFGIAERIVSLDWLDFDSLLSFTVNADCGVLLYSNNDLGNFFSAPGRLTEYLACGLPVVASNHTGIENLVMRFDLGVTVAAEDPQSIATGLLELEKRKRCGSYEKARMRDVFLSHFSFDLWEPRLKAAFRDLLKPASLKRIRPAFPWLP